MKKSILPGLLTLVYFLLAGCQSSQPFQPILKIDGSTAKVSTSKTTQVLDKLYMAQLRRSPMALTYFGYDEGKDQWDDLSEKAALKTQVLLKQQWDTINALDTQGLDSQSALNIRLFKVMLGNKIADYEWRDYGYVGYPVLPYPVNQMFGLHSEPVALLINQHTIKSVQDADTYIARLKGLTLFFDQLIEQLNRRAEKGIIPPKFVFPKVIQDSRNLLLGAPFTEGKPSTLLADFTRKVNALELLDTKKKRLIEEAVDALQTHVKPANEKLIACLQQMEKRADTRSGVWKLPNGNAFYAYALKRTTSTDLTADEIHSIGYREVGRIQGEMQAIMAAVKFTGSLQAFFEFVRNDPQFIYPQTEAGKRRYLNEATAIIDAIKPRLDELFTTQPKVDLIVKPVEAYRESSAGIAFYSPSSIDGSRSGSYYANLYRMSDMPWYKMQALAYHEGIPGHHMQFAMTAEQENLPLFLKIESNTAHFEGWGLYAELLPKEIGLYQNPYSDFGRLAMELWRAARLVVDTGIHAKHWTREQAIDWLKANTPNPENEIIKGVERYIVMPAQATAYKIGMLKILTLREQAKDQLGDKFDIRKYHDVVLKNGALPLDVLNDLVNQWIAAETRRP